MADNTREVLGFDPRFTECSSHVQVWRGWIITRDGIEIWRSTSHNGDRVVSTVLDGKCYKVPAYRVLGIANLVDASTLDEFTYTYLTSLIYGDEYNRSPFAVHHIDGNHHNNKASNLAVLHKRDHQEAHRLLEKEVIPAVFSNDPYCVEFVKRKYLEFVSIHSSYDYIVNTY